jgi:hypothetical protein
MGKPQNNSKKENVGTGQKSIFCEVCFVPGTSFEKAQQFEIGGFGILKIV